jgi:GxxExxY protein
MRRVDEVSGLVVDAAFRLHRDIGPGLMESFYEQILASRLEKQGLKVERQRTASFEYDGVLFNEACRIDLLVDEQVVVELKSAEKLAPVHSKQLLTYLRILDLRVGLLINFGAADFQDVIKRVVNQYRTERVVPLRVPSH